MRPGNSLGLRLLSERSWRAPAARQIAMAATAASNDPLLAARMIFPRTRSDRSTLGVT